ncbi:hypothetical protein GCM10010193_31590 [Kitasatospora atroaurantiaca]|uniref:PKD repeat protein n=1 Tax=Kitasatospora atroaurantiaca TaxID=285545 RepID=A0A561ERA4_9ACTN|nr:PKD domain-containing protein [Kitasatospora atroaurantiaca]TWE18145.1 PKD repeat protein [Kitasatospora atroaurantiaca]
MRRPRALGVSVAVLTGVLGLPAPAASAVPDNLYVNNALGSNCSDTGAGTQAQPYCTISAAAAVVQPGQTVQVSGAGYSDSVNITRSGTKDAPITFVGSGNAVGLGSETTPAFTVSGAHDVVIRGFNTHSGIAVQDSSGVLIDGNVAWSRIKPARPWLAITGTSANVTVLHNQLRSTNGVSVGAGVTGTTISGNSVSWSFGTAAIAVDGAPNTTITNNTVAVGCGPGIMVTGAATGLGLYNNVVTGHDSMNAFGSPCPSKTATEIQVAAEATQGSRADYNLVWPKNSGLAYSWGGQSYGTPALLNAATGQGTHDLLADPHYAGPNFGIPLDCQLLADGTPDKSTCSPAIDSADPTAPGVPSTDIRGLPIVRDPLVDHSGAGNLDRGAFELQDYLQDNVELSSNYADAPSGSELTFTATAHSQWLSTVTYRFDFGDGTSATTTGTPTATHTYTAPCDCKASVTVTAEGGKQTAAGAPVSLTITTPGPLAAHFSATAKLDDHPLTVAVDSRATVSSAPVAKFTFDYGDGTTTSGPWPTSTHSYKRPGDYLITVTAQDAKGQTSSTSQYFVAAYAPSTYTAVAPTRLLDTRTSSGPLHGGGALVLNIPNPANAEAVVLNITATNVSSDTFLTVWPDGQARPYSSNLNAKAGQTVANLVTVPVGSDGSVQIFNHSGNADVVADFVGYYQPDGGQKFTPSGPSRLLDTRPAGSLAPAEVRSVQVAGKSGVPANASAVVLNLTATEPTASGYLTAYPHGGATPKASSINFRPGQTVANQAIVPIGQDGKIDLYNFAGNTQVVADVFGYYSPDSQGVFTPVSPVRLTDTRYGSFPRPLPGGGKLPVQVTGSFDVVPMNATAAVLNVTATETTAYGYLSVVPGGDPHPGATSNLNFGPGQTVPNHVITPLGTNGQADIYNFAGNTHVIADLFGYFTKG